MKEGRIFGDPGSSRLWASRVRASNDSGSVRIPPRSVAIVIVDGSEVPWKQKGGESGTFAPSTVGWILTRRNDLVLDSTETTDSIVVGFHRNLFESLTEPFRSELLPELESAFAGNDDEDSAVVIRVIPPVSVFSRILPELADAPTTGAARSFHFEGQIRLLLSRVCFRRSGASVGTGPAEALPGNDRVALVRRILDENFAQPLDLTDVASRVGCSSAHLSRTFSTATGMTMSQYVRKRRIEEAEKILSRGGYAIGEVARRVGYRSVSHFSKAFLLEKGYSPSKRETG